MRSSRLPGSYDPRVTDRAGVAKGPGHAGGKTRGWHRAVRRPHPGVWQDDPDPTRSASGVSRGMSFAQPTMNSSAFGSRSLLRNGEGSIELNNCFNSARWTSMTAHLGGSGSPAECLLPSYWVVSAIVEVYGRSTAYAPAHPCSDTLYERSVAELHTFFAEPCGSIFGLAFAGTDHRNVEFEVTLWMLVRTCRI